MKSFFQLRKKFKILFFFLTHFFSLLLSFFPNCLHSHTPIHTAHTVYHPLSCARALSFLLQIRREIRPATFHNGCGVFISSCIRLFCEKDHGGAQRRAVCATHYSLHV